MRLLGASRPQGGEDLPRRRPDLGVGGLVEILHLVVRGVQDDDLATRQSPKQNPLEESVSQGPWCTPTHAGATPKKGI